MSSKNSLLNAWRCRILFIVVLLVPTGALAQTSPSMSPSPLPQVKPTPTLERRLFKNILLDQKAIWTSPFRMKRDDVRWVLPLGLTTTALIATDRRTAGEIREFDDQLTASRNISLLATAAAGGSAAFYLIGRARGDRRARETGLLGIESLLDGLIVSGTLKEITRRSRPLSDGGRGRFFSGGNSFPSGHAVAAWSFATVVANEYGDNRFIKFTAYGLASAVSISRYTGYKHFLSDVLVGSAIGYGIGRYVYRTRHDPNIDSGDDFTPQRQRSKLFPSIAPTYDRRAREYGATLAWNF